MIAKMESEGFLYDRDRYRLIICNTSDEINEIFSAL
jgi:hypothetical protein